MASNTSSKGVSLLDAGVARALGSKQAQEDCYAAVLPEDFPATSGDHQAYFAVYDGHGSADTANHAAIHLHKHFIARPEFEEGRYEDAINAALTDEDNMLLQLYRDGYKGFLSSGSTVALAYLNLTKGILVAANLGDSHVILADCNIRSGKSRTIKRLTRSHEPSSPTERARIEEAGGRVNDTTDTIRVGALNMSRTLGDLQYKNPLNQAKNTTLEMRGVATSMIPKDRGDIISNRPHVSTIQLEPNRQYALSIVTDGVTHAANDDTIMDLTLKMAADGVQAQEISREIVAMELNYRGADNATCITVLLGS